MSVPDKAASPPADRRRPRDQIAEFLRAMFLPGDVFEVRALKCADRPGSSFRGTTRGYFTFEMIDQAATAIAALDARKLAAGIYVTLNPVQPALLARAGGRLETNAKATTSDADVPRRRRLLLDFDPVRPSDVSATGGELELARLRSDEVLAWLRGRGWPEPVRVMSGNGHHLIFEIDLPAADDGLVEGVLKALAARFDDNAVKLDTTVHNPSRITKIAGTTPRKGDDLRGTPGVEGRPHRRAEIVSLPKEMASVSRAMLEELVEEARAVGVAPATSGPRPSSPHRTQPGNSTGSKFERFDHTPDGVAGYLGGRGIRVVRRSRKEGATWLHLERCPVVEDCTASSGTDISVVVADNGAIGYKNQHNRGAGLAWSDVREALEPGYKEFASRRTTTVRSDAGEVEPPREWRNPQPLPPLLPPVMKFDAALLPGALRAWIVDIADRIQCPIDFPAVAVMVAIASLVGRKIGIRPKRRDDWLVVPNLWGMVIGRPGVMKTPSILEPLRPLNQLEAAAKKKYDEERISHDAARLVDKARQKHTESAIRDAIKKKQDPHEIAREAMEAVTDEPVRRRYVVNDSTVEKLGEILNQNPNGVLAFRDELIGLLKSLDKEGQESARAFYLESWAGTSRFTYDRIGRGTLDIEAAILSILGSIQPGPLMEYLRGATREGKGDDGLLQRFQLAVWPDIDAAWKNVDRWPDSEARRFACRVFEWLDQLDATLVLADPDPHDPGGIPFLRFDDQAQDLFNEWRTELEHRLRSGELVPALESHLAKYRSLVPSLALLVHVAEGRRGPVGIAALRMALGWAKYLESHARRIYAQATTPHLAAARSLAKHILAGDLKDGFALRDVYRRGWSALSDSDEAKEAAELLVDLDWLHPVSTQTAGRTGTVYHINPRLAGTDPRELLNPREGELTEPTEAPAVSSVGPAGGVSDDSRRSAGELAPPSPARGTPSVGSVSPPGGASADSRPAAAAPSSSSAAGSNGLADPSVGSVSSSGGGVANSRPPPAQRPPLEDGSSPGDPPANGALEPRPDDDGEEGEWTA